MSSLTPATFRMTISTSVKAATGVVGAVAVDGEVCSVLCEAIAVVGEVCSVLCEAVAVDGEVCSVGALLPQWL